MASPTGKKAKKGTVDECSDNEPGQSAKSPIVRVSFTPPKDFGFSCTSINMRAAGKIQMHQAADQGPWVFVCTNGLPCAEFTYDVAGDGKTMTIDDKHATICNYEYGITVRQGNQDYPSDDRGIITPPPMIRNQ